MAPADANASTDGAAPSYAKAVLLADDDDALRPMVTRFLTRAGLQVIVAKDGAEAVALFHANAASIGLVLVDLEMPHLDGAGALFAILDVAPRLPCILMSGYADPTPPCRALIARGVRFIAKPIIAPDLARTVREMLNTPA